MSHFLHNYFLPLHVIGDVTLAQSSIPIQSMALSEENKVYFKMSQMAPLDSLTTVCDR